MEHSNHAPLEYVEARVREMAQEAMEMRGITQYTLKSTGVETQVEHAATAFAAICLWFKDLVK